MDTEKNHDKKAADGEKAPAKKVKRQPTQEQLDHPLHGVKLSEILESLVGNYGWEYLANEVNIMCFKHNPTIKVSLKFLRKYKWAREHVQDIYVRMVEAGIDPNMYKNKKAPKNNEPEID
mmetsp:Transcript_32561/g.43004  ORF Transcript_32561/g.43004 Transcript_32561/m.43004 type:complete len:120 (+) Transcript_32561:395-754(+)